MEGENEEYSFLKMPRWELKRDEENKNIFEATLFNSGRSLLTLIIEVETNNKTKKMNIKKSNGWKNLHKDLLMLLINEIKEKELNF